MAFRLRIALLSLSASGVLLVVFGIFFLTIVQRVGLERVDREIRALADSQLQGRQPGGRWRNVERSLRFIYGEESADRLAIQVRDAGREVLFTSPSFPEEIASLSLPVLAFRPRPADRPDRGGDAAVEGRDSEDRPPPGVDLVARLDADANGRVSIEEFDGPAGDFAELDADGDGSLTDSEAREAVRHRPPRQKEPVFQTVKTSTGEWRVGFLGNEHVYLTIGVNLADLSQETRRFRLGLSPGHGCIPAGACRCGMVARRPRPASGRALDADGRERHGRRSRPARARSGDRSRAGQAR